MTKDDIYNLSDERLNRMVAEHVMGYSIYHYDKDVPERCYYMLVNEKFDPSANDVPWSWHNGERKTEEEAWNDCPNFVGEIVYAWEIVIEMAGKTEAQKEIFNDETNYTLFNITPRLICQAARIAIQ